MRTMTETEDRLRATLRMVALSVDPSEGEAPDGASSDSLTVAPITPTPGRRSRRRSPLLVFAASFLAVLVFGASGILVGGDQPVGESTRPVDLGTSPSSTPAVAKFWAETLAATVDSVSRWDTFGSDTPDREARVIEATQAGDPFGDGGSIVATAATADDRLTVRAEYQGRDEAIDQAALQLEAAELTADGVTRHVDTIWHSPQEDSASTDSTVQAEYFLTALAPESTRITVLTSLGLLVVELDASHDSALFTHDQLMGIASSMTSTSLDLTWNPDHPLSTEAEPLAEPHEDDWIALAQDMWIATVDEDGGDRLWVKSDIQEPTPAPSVDSRSLYAYAGADFVVIVVGNPMPEAITVNWDDHSSETVKPVWNTDLDLGFARFANHDAKVVSVDGP